MSPELVVDVESAEVPEAEADLLRPVARVAQQPLLLSTDALRQGDDVLLPDEIPHLVVARHYGRHAHRRFHRDHAHLFGLGGHDRGAEIGQVLLEQLAEFPVEVLELELIEADNEVVRLIQPLVSVPDAKDAALLGHLFEHLGQFGLVHANPGRDGLNLFRFIP